jgi:hypothetical protein
MNNASTGQRARRLRPFRTAGSILGWIVLLGTIGWGALAINYSNLPGGVRPVAAALFGILSLAGLILVRPRRRAVLGYLVFFAALVAWWLAIPPSNDRDWQPDVAVLPYADIEGDKVTIHNIRNADYRTETDYTVRHYDATFDLKKLQSADGYLVYWGSPMIAHTMMSFGFGDGRYVCISIETRKRIGQEYSAIKGFFKQYTLTYIVADERDVVRLRTNFRHEDVYLFRLKASQDVIRKVFLDYLREVNRLHDRPEWYNALTTNCTTDIRKHTAPYNPNARWDWRFIVNGYLDEFMYEQGAIDKSLPLVELKKRSYINPKAIAADNAADFSTQIREGLPGF